MSYYFIKKATTNFGPINFPLYVLPQQSIAEAVARAAFERGVIVCHDWIAEPLSEGEYRDMFRAA
ncbi:MAG TPA: hypothetical protein PLY87_19475 [Planctomycetaceae bacterium]|nr:hypothetical protein [Planctomycetaceae bacterium]